MIEAELILEQALQPLKDSGDIGLYHYGSEDELIKVFSVNAIKYPVVWLEMPLGGANTQSIYKKELNTTLRLILATSSKKEWFNDNRNKETYFKVLNPLYDKVLQAVNQFKFIDITSRELTVRKLHNYHTNDQGRTPKDYWDVIIVEFDARIKNIC